MKYLCSHHRQQLQQSPTRAIESWNKWMDIGGHLVDQQNWERAKGYFGCCYEIADWLLMQPELLADEAELNYIDRFMVAGHHLAEAYGRIERHDIELHYLLTVHTRVFHYARNKNHPHWSLKNNLEVSMLMLTRFTQLQGSFKGYEECYSETEAQITRLKRQLN